MNWCVFNYRLITQNNSHNISTSLTCSYINLDWTKEGWFELGYREHWEDWDECYQCCREQP